MAQMSISWGMDEQIVSIHAVGCHLTVNGDEAPMPATTWVNLENIMPVARTMYDSSYMNCLE